MATYLPPNPVPTPYQPTSLGGAAQVPVGSTGPSYSSGFIGPVITYGQNSGGATNPINIPRSPAPDMSTYSVGGGGGGGSTGSIQPTQTQSGPTDAEYDALGVARGDIGGYNRVKQEQAQQQNNTFRTPEGWDFQGTRDEYMRQIDDTFNNIMGYLNQNVGILGQNRSSAEQQAQADYAANEALLGQQKSEANRNLQEQGITAERKKEDALAQARRLYRDLSGASQRRFGALSGAGQGMSDILGSELQQQFGQTNRQAMDVGREIAQATQTVQEKYDAGIMQLKQAVQTAKAKIQSDFVNAMMQINNMKGAAESEKGAAKLNALKSVRDQMNAIKMQDYTFSQQLEAMKQQALLNVQSYNQTAGQAVQAGGAAVSQFNPVYNDFSAVPSGTQFSQPVEMQGMIVRGKDYKGRTIWEDPTTGEVTYGWTNPQTGR